MEECYLLLVKLQALSFKPATLLKVTPLHRCFSRFFKLYKWYQIVQIIIHVLVIAQQRKIRFRQFMLRISSLSLLPSQHLPAQS